MGKEKGGEKMDERERRQGNRKNPFFLIILSATAKLAAFSHLFAAFGSLFGLGIGRRRIKTAKFACAESTFLSSKAAERPLIFISH